ncbi:MULTISPECIES: lysine/arginine/ornithine ABC transporter substrate-binding protein [unclassified Mesorhizobium]|uniref:lysine/arginine/ornithine ABC transporter substrate-binding protein n=1 Tax=unclassified Mesorhizobium TaxID=325217 RepID=UPI001FEF1D13|nr:MULTISPECIES: lysine/arginine/ornithine ABC transporter substrate-binding protein [unclassified Mesorhizobium]
MASSTIALAGQAHAQDKKSITIATEAAYAPYEYKDAAGKIVGFDIDLGKDLCKRISVECTVIDTAWDGIIPSLTAGKFDAIMGGMDINDEREKVIAFAGPYLQTPVRFIAPKSSPLIKLKTSMDTLTLDDVSPDEHAVLDQLAATLQGKKVGVQVSTTSEAFVRKFLPTVEVSTYDTADNMVLDLNSGRIDLSLSTMARLLPLTKTSEGKDLAIFGPNMTGGPFGKGVGIGVRKEDEALKVKFNKAIADAIADGTVKELSTKWFEFDGTPKH